MNPPVLKYSLNTTYKKNLIMQRYCSMPTFRRKKGYRKKRDKSEKNPGDILHVNRTSV
jgi:hypothetical protein